MLNELDLPDAMVQDGLAFAQLMEDERLWPAIGRLFAKMNDDAISLWSQDDGDKYGKKWLRGYRECLNDVLKRIEDNGKLAVAHVEAKRLEQATERIKLDEGTGAGDMAIA